MGMNQFISRLSRDAAAWKIEKETEGTLKYYKFLASLAFIPLLASFGGWQALVMIAVSAIYFLPEEEKTQQDSSVAIS